MGTQKLISQAKNQEVVIVNFMCYQNSVSVSLFNGISTLVNVKRDLNSNSLTTMSQSSELATAPQVIKTNYALNWVQYIKLIWLKEMNCILFKFLFLTWLNGIEIFIDLVKFSFMAYKPLNAKICLYIYIKYIYMIWKHILLIIFFTQLNGFKYFYLTRILFTITHLFAHS